MLDHKLAATQTPKEVAFCPAKNIWRQVPSWIIWTCIHTTHLTPLQDNLPAFLRVRELWQC